MKIAFLFSHKFFHIILITFTFWAVNEKRVFHFNIKDNNLSIIVLGTFTNSTKEVTFLNCGFVDNIPDMAGNPAFNFLDNYTDLEDKILFDHCTFKKNKAFKWYGEKIELIDCKMDSSGFFGLK